MCAPSRCSLDIAQVVGGEFQFAEIARERHLGFVGEALVVEDHDAEFVHALFDFGRLFPGQRLRDVDAGRDAAEERARHRIDWTDG